MKCPHCDNDTRVKETRLMDGDVVRRRECTNCNSVFGTRESVDETSTIGIGSGNHPNSKARPWAALTDAWRKHRG